MTTGGGTNERMRTGISGFDQISLGGLPAGRCTLLTGSTGSGKTLFAVEFLARGIIGFDDPGVFVTFEETPSNIRANWASLGFDIERWEAEDRWAFVDASVYSGEEAETVGAYDLGGLVARIDHAIRRVGARRVSLDSLGAIFTRFRDVENIRQKLRWVATALDTLGVTSVLTAERVEEYDGVSRFGVEEFVLDNVVVLRNVLQNERRRRTVEVVKLRGATHRTGEWLFTIDPRDGFVVIPLTFIIPREHASRVRVSTGNAGLDEMIGGGLYQDAIALLTAPTGAGKTLTALKFADAAYRTRERCLLCTFDETREQLSRNAAGWGLDLDAMQASGLLWVIADYPELASLEDHFLQLRGAITEYAPSRLVIDTLSALGRITSPRALLDFIIALGAVLRQRDITTLFTSTPTLTGALGITPALALDIASLTDVTIALRYIERAGEIQRAIAILQTRGSDHDRAIRQATIDGTGMHIGAPLPDVSGIIQGIGSLHERPPAWPDAADGP
jgi:circadian clock protein KaiC